MRERFRHLPAASRALVIMVLAAAGVASWWWLGEQRAVAPAVTETPRHPDSYFRDLDLTGHDVNGRPDMHVTATYAEHFEDEPWIHLHDLRARSAEDGPVWQLTAERGRMTDDGVTLETWGNVVLVRGDADDTPMQLHTERLTVNTETELAVTDAAVRITHGTGEISGRGLRVSLADDRMEIESDVEARYGK